MADAVTLSLNNWELFLALMITGFCMGFGGETAKYLFERYFRKRLDRVEINVGKEGVELVTKKTLTPTSHSQKTQYQDLDEEEEENSRPNYYKRRKPWE